jgi:hypothetical protein
MARRTDPLIRTSLLTAVGLTTWLVCISHWPHLWLAAIVFILVLAVEVALYGLPLKSTTRWIHLAFIATFFFSYRIETHRGFNSLYIGNLILEFICIVGMLTTAPRQKRTVPIEKKTQE